MNNNSNLNENVIHPINGIVNMVIDVCFCVQCMYSTMLIGVSFEKQIFESHQAFLFEADHHFIAQAKRDQLEVNIEKIINYLRWQRQTLC